MSPFSTGWSSGPMQLFGGGGGGYGGGGRGHSPYRFADYGIGQGGFQTGPFAGPDPASTEFNRTRELTMGPVNAQLAAQQGRFNAIFPLLQGQFNANANPIGGQPRVDVGPIWNDQQIQQQVNAGRAQTDAATEARTREMQQSLGGRGFGANSPLAAALGTQYQNAGLSANTANERETRWNAAQGNAGHIFKTQMGREQAQIEREKPRWAQQSALLAALAGLV